ncbi:MAG: DUF1206 domain-containing protein [Alphaproteobacteria bacterium]
MLSETTKQSRSLSGDKPDLAWSVPVMRAGFAGRGLVYLAVALFSLYAIWQGRQAQGTTSALRNLEASVAGGIVLALIALGMLAFAVWCAVEAFYDLDARGSDAKGIAARIGMIVSGLVALGISGAALSLLLADLGASGSVAGSGSGTGRSHIEQGVAAVLGWPAGRWIVGAVGLAIVGSGIAQLVEGWTEKYRRYLIANHFTQRWNWVLKAGLMGRGVLIGVIGVLFVLAAWRADPDEAGGLDEAFAWLTQQPYGWHCRGALRRPARIRAVLLCQRRLSLRPEGRAGRCQDPGSAPKGDAATGDVTASHRVDDDGCAARFFAAHSRGDCISGSVMRGFLASALVVLVLVGCGTPIPSKDDFGASALLAARDVPSGFAEFNRFGAATHDYVAEQLCATPFQRLEETAMEASPGRFEQLVTRCRTHVPLFGS